MKRSIIILLILALILAFNSHGQETAKRSRKAKGETAMSVSMPYTANYSSQFAMGNPQDAAMILSLYKDFENKDWSKDSWFADTVMVLYSDGSVSRGKDQVLENFKKYRESLTGVSFDLAAFMPLKSLDRNENWVAIWGIQAVTPADGSGEKKFDFQAVWKINDEKKVAFVRFFEAKLPEGQ